MEAEWIFVILAWGAIIGIIIACFIPELRKTPQQRKAEAEIARESRKKNREEEKRKRQEAQDHAPSKGCLQSTAEFGCLCLFFMFTVIVCIMFLIASGS